MAGVKDSTSTGWLEEVVWDGGSFGCRGGKLQLRVVVDKLRGDMGAIARAIARYRQD